MMRCSHCYLTYYDERKDYFKLMTRKSVYYVNVFVITMKDHRYKLKGCRTKHSCIGSLLAFYEKSSMESIGKCYTEEDYEVDKQREREGMLDKVPASGLACTIL